MRRCFPQADFFFFQFFISTSFYFKFFAYICSMKRLFVIILAVWLYAGPSLAQEQKLEMTRSVKKLETYIDTITKRGVDKRYIEVPAKPWQIVLKYNCNEVDLISTSMVSAEKMAMLGINGVSNTEVSFNPRLSTSIGVWLGYRGYGLGYSFSITGNNGRNLALSVSGYNYGLNLRLRKFTTDRLDAHMWGNDEFGPYDLYEKDAMAFDDISVNSLIFDGYYLLNGKRFSYSAAYDQSVKQIRSAGSFVAGAMWFHTSFNMSQWLNAPLVQLMSNIGRVKIDEGALGMGYAYNWVPVKNLLFNVTAIPMLVLYNHTKMYLYESNYDIFLSEGEISPTGKKAYPDDLNDTSWMDDVILYQTGTAVRHSKVSFNLDAHFSVVYNWNNFYFNINGQWNYFHNKFDDNKIKLYDWYINALIGIRL